MKANAPEKLYFGESDKGILDIYSNRESNDEVEYTRTDAFIEKACFYIKNMVLDITYLDVDGKESYKIDEFIDDFKRYMEGE